MIEPPKSKRPIRSEKRSASVPRQNKKVQNDATIVVPDIENGDARENSKKAAPGAKGVFVFVLQIVVSLIYNLGNAVLCFFAAVFSRANARAAFSAAAGFFTKAARFAARRAAAGRVVSRVFRKDFWRGIAHTATLESLHLLTGIEKSEIELPVAPDKRRGYAALVFHRNLKWLVPLLCVVTVAAVAASVGRYTVGVKVFVDGVEVGILAGEDGYTQVEKDVETYIGRIIGGSYDININATFETVLVNKTIPDDKEAVRQIMLRSATDVITESYGLYVNGELAAVNPNGAAMLSLLDEELAKQAALQDDPGARVEFVQALTVSKGLVPKSYEMSLLDITDLLHTTKVEEQAYTVQSGDTLSGIAGKYGMSQSELVALNPGIDQSVLRIGQTVVVSAAVPLVSVKVIKTVEYDEEVPYSTVRTNTDSLYVNQTRTEVRGVNGSDHVVAEVTLINGVEQSRVELSRVRTREPVTAEVLVGTRALPAKVATGSFRRPTTGTYTSYYGVRRGSSYHTGLDIANSYGTAIVAADGGTVVTSGWTGSYGYCIVIDHGNGYRTRYAHCSSLLVSVGQKVAKGETIARMGSTGNSTGNHLHFEVIYNGQTQNPLNYI